MEYNILMDSKTILTGGKKDVVDFIIARDVWRLGRTPDVIKARYCGDGTLGYNADAYVPTFFDAAAMNPNDTRALTTARYSVTPTKPTGFPADKVARPYMVTDETGRVVDVREWLEDCRDALRSYVPKVTEPNFKQYNFAYRNVSGLRQALSVPYVADEDYLRLAGNVPSRLTRKPRGKNAGSPRLRNISKSWKEIKGCVRSWQKNSVRGRMPKKTAAELDIQSLAAELVAPTFEQRLAAEF